MFKTIKKLRYRIVSLVFFKYNHVSVHREMDALLYSNDSFYGCSVFDFEKKSVTRKHHTFFRNYGVKG